MWTIRWVLFLYILLYTPWPYLWPMTGALYFTPQCIPRMEHITTLSENSMIWNYPSSRRVPMKMTELAGKNAGAFEQLFQGCRLAVEIIYACLQSTNHALMGCLSMIVTVDHSIYVAVNQNFSRLPHNLEPWNLMLYIKDQK